MLVYLVAAAEALAYLWAVPLHLAFCLRAGSELKAGLGLAAFARRAALERAVRRAAGKRRRRRKRGAPLPLLWNMLRRLRLESFVLRGTLCLGDAAATAMVCGGMRALEAALRGVAPGVRLRVTPDFEGRPGAALQGMLRVRLGNIICAAAGGALNTANGRIAQWISTRLKT